MKKVVVRKVFSIVIIIVLVSMAANLVKQVAVSYQLKKKIAEKREELRVLEEENRELQTKLKEVQSPEFLQKMKEKLSGEGQNRPEILPTEVAAPPVELRVEEELPGYRKWLKKWLKVFFH